MNVIITAAGLGSRLGGLTEARPKCLLPVGDATILEHQLRAFAEHGLRDVVVVRGHGAECFDLPGPTYLDNPLYATTNMLHSLMCASQYLTDGFITTYSDILFDEDTVAALLEPDDDLVIVVDTAWRQAYAGRDQHPVGEAEKVIHDDRGYVRHIGKVIPRPHHTHGEFIGLMRATARGAWLFRKMYERTLASFTGRPFMQARTFEAAMVTEFLQHLVDHKVRVRCATIAGGWHEIDTPQDLDNARRKWRTREPIA